MDFVRKNNLTLLCTAVCTLTFAFSHHASALTIGDVHQVGAIVHGNVGDNNRTILINHLIGMALGTSDTFMSENFTRSMNNFGSLPSVLANGTNGSGTSVALGNSGLYSYLWAHYGGPGGGTVQVWYVGDLNGTITIPGLNGQYGLSGWTLFGPGGQGVPDSGTTAMLLGTALSALGVARRYIMR
jgi:hypothetical protein